MITKFTRKHLMNACTSMTMLVCLFFATWNSFGSDKISKDNFSGEEMFRGIFFVEGNYANLIPELKTTQTTYLFQHLSSAEKHSLSSVKNQIINQIKAENPSYFDNFKESLNTSNPIVVKEKLLEAKTLLTEKALELSKINQHDLKLASSILSKDNSSIIGKKTYEKVIAQFSNGNNVKSNNSRNGLVLAISVLAVYQVLTWWAVTTGGEELAINPLNSSNLMFEQIIASICKASAHAHS